MSETIEAIRDLGTETTVPFDEAAFARDNFFNAYASSVERLRSTSTFQAVFSHIVRADGVPISPQLTEFLDETYRAFRITDTGREPFGDKTRIERTLAAFDSFIFDKYQLTFTPHVEGVKQYGRFTVRYALTNGLQLTRAS